VAFRDVRGNQRTMIEMGLAGVVATQLWHHTYIDASLADLPAWTPPGNRGSTLGGRPATQSPGRTS
jgi:asparagine synthase (glutamine-hydrolysing)